MDIGKPGEGGAKKTMSLEISLFTEPGELITWLKEHEPNVNLSPVEAGILLDYLEGHDFAIGTDGTGNLFRKDIAEEQGDTEAYSIDDVINCVCEWNYELILDADMKRNNPKDFIDFSNEQSRYQKLKTDEMLLDKMFDRTKYGKDCEEMGKKLAEEFIANLARSKDVSACVETISKEIKTYGTGNRGR